jgi:hypothetical protein
LAQLDAPSFSSNFIQENAGDMAKNGIHLVAGDNSKQNDSHQKVPTARLQKFGFIADIVVSNHHDSGTIYHYVVQPEGSREIVFWGQELSFKRALDSVETFFEPYRRALRTA